MATWTRRSFASARARRSASASDAAARFSAAWTPATSRESIRSVSLDRKAFPNARVASASGRSAATTSAATRPSAERVTGGRPRVVGAGDVALSPERVSVDRGERMIQPAVSNPNRPAVATGADEYVPPRAAAIIDAMFEEARRRDPLFDEHAWGVARLATAAGAHLGLTGPRLELLAFAARVHDLGKA